MQNKRLEFFDLISGFFIIEIIIIHILQFAGKLDNEIFSVILHVFFFRLPWLYFKSGYFFKPFDRIDKKFLIEKSKKLLVPFVIFTIIGFIVTFPFELYEAKRPVWRILLSLPYSVLWKGNGGDGNLPLWFLLSLFFTILFFGQLERWNLTWVIMLFPLVGFISQYYNIIIPMGQINIFIAVFYFYIGNTFRKIENTMPLKYVLAVSIIIFLFTQLFWFSDLDFMSHQMIKRNYFIYILSSICGLVIFYYLGKRINFIKPINFVGRNAMLYFISHYPIIVLINNVFSKLSIQTSGYIYASILILFVFIIIPFCSNAINKKFSFIVGN